MNLRKVSLILGILIIFIGILTLSNQNYVDKTGALPSEEVSGNSKTAHELVKEIKIGYNIGNTLDSANYKKEYLGTEQGVSYYETLWHNPQITEELILALKNAGFDSIRVPITYYDHIHHDGTIDELWLNRVEEVVNLVLKNDMHCIINIHHDAGLFEGGSWILADASNYETTANDVRNMWLQIATRFKDYDYRLIFEGVNEIVDSNKNYSWDYGYENVLVVNDLNQVFVNTVRETGSKNLDRFLIVSTYAAITDEQKLNAFTMPADIADDKIILGLHDYANTEDEIVKMLNRIKTLAISKGIPVMLDEFGTTNSMSEEERTAIAKKYVSMAYELNIPCYWWDNGGDYALIDRNSLTWKYESIKDAMMSVFPNEDDYSDTDKDNEEDNIEDNNNTEDNEGEEIDSKDDEEEKEVIEEKPNESEPDNEETEKPSLSNPNEENKDENIEIITNPILPSDTNNVAVEQPTVPSNSNEVIQVKEEPTTTSEIKKDNTNVSYATNNDTVIAYIPDTSTDIKYDDSVNEEKVIYDGLSVETIPSKKLSSSETNNKEGNNSIRLFKLGILLGILILIIVLTILLNKKVLKNN